MSEKEHEQDRLDREVREQREAAQQVLAEQEAANYLRTHDAQAAAEYAFLMATRTEQHQSETKPEE